MTDQVLNSLRHHDELSATAGSPKRLVIGPYRMGFELTPSGSESLLRVFIDYALPTGWPDRWLGRVFGGYYAHWRTQSMVDDAVRRFAATDMSSARASRG